MADYPVHGSFNWDPQLKIYIDTADQQNDDDITAVGTSLSDHIADPDGAHAASAISFTPTGDISSTDVQDAIVEVRDELQGHFLAIDDRGVVYGPNGFPGPLNVSNDPTWDITDLPEPLGHFTSGLGSQFVNPDPPDAASGGMVNAAIVTQIEGTAESNPTNKLFLDGLLLRLGLQSYDDSAATDYAAATGIELDIAIDGSGNNIQNIKGVYVVPIAGQLLGSGQPVSGSIESLEMVRTDTLQTGYVDAFLHFDQAIGVHAGRPIADPVNVTYDVQYSLLADRGQLFYTRYSETIAWFGISDDSDNTKVVWQRINPSGSLEFCKTDGTVLATLSNTGVFTANVPTQSPGDSSTKAASTAFVAAADATAVHIAGTETITGAKTFSSVITGTANLALSAAVATARDITYQTSGSPRWILRCANTAEPGGDAGAEFQIISRTDAGASKAVVFQAQRTTGQVLMTAYPVKGFSSNTAGRPTAANAGVGATMFDTTLAKPIWSDGTNWKDATGTNV